MRKKKDEPPSFFKKLFFAFLIAFLLLLFAMRKVASYEPQPIQSQPQTRELPLEAEVVGAIRPVPIPERYPGLRGQAREIARYVQDKVGPEWQDWFLDTIFCESQFNPEARSSTNCKGILQFADRTFYANGGQEIWDWQDQINTAWRMIQRNPYAIEFWECSEIMGY